MMMTTTAPTSGPSVKPSNRHARMFGSYRQLSPPAYKVLGTLREYVFDGECRLIDYGWLVNETGLSSSTVSRAMQEITEAGFILRQRECPGRGHLYQVQMLPPPETRVHIGDRGSGIGDRAEWRVEHAACSMQEPVPEAASHSPSSIDHAPLETPTPEDPPHQDYLFLSPETLQERSENVAPVKHSEDEISPIRTTQNGVIHTPLRESTKQQQKDGDRAAETVNVDNPPPSASPAIVPPAHLAPHQQALFVALHHHHAEMVALDLVQRRPDLTVADLEHDLAAAQARPNVTLPLGLVCAAWLAGSRVTPPRSIGGQGSGVGGQEAAPSHQAAPLTETQRYLLDQKFSAKAAEEFRDFDLAAVQEGMRDTLRFYDTDDERNLKIGRLVQRWRACPPKPIAQPADTAPEGWEDDDDVGWEEADAVPDRAPPHQALRAAGYRCDATGIYVCAPATQADLDALWRAQHGPDALPPPVSTPTAPVPACAAQSAPEPVRVGAMPSAPPVPMAEGVGLVWAQALAQMRQWLVSDEYARLERETSLISIDARRRVAVVGCPNVARRDDIEYRYLAVIRRALTVVVGGTVQVHFIIRRC